MTSVKVSTYDVFRFGNPRTGWGCGQILWSESLIYVVVFEPVFRTKKNELDEVIASRPLLAGWTMDARIQSGTWEMLGNTEPNRTILFPEYKVEIAGKIWVTNFEGRRLRLATAEEQRLLRPRASHSPIAYEKAFWAFHSGSWEIRFDELLTPESRFDQ